MLEHFSIHSDAAKSVHCSSLLRRHCRVFPFLIALGTATGAASAQCGQWTGGTALTGGEASAAVVWDPDGAGPLAPRLVVGGSFTAVGTLPVGRVAVWDGASWSTLHTGMDGPVIALAVHNGELYAGGNFFNASGSPARNIAKWSGTAWQAVGGGLNNGAVTSLTTFGGELHAAGTFVPSGAFTPRRVARLPSGGTWQPLGPGVNDVAYGIGNWNGVLIVNGSFSNTGDTTVPMNRLGRWTPSGGGAGTWSAFVPPLVAASGLDSTRRTLPFGSDLIVGGSWFDGTGTITPCVARFTGSSWQRMGNGLTNVVESLVVYAGRVHAGGGFLNSGSTVVNRVAMWDGTAWTALNGGTSGVVRALVVFNGDLYAFGNFTQAGTATVGNWARYRSTAICPPDFDCSGGVPNVADIFAFLTAWFASNPSANFDGVGGVTVADIFAFLSAWFAGC